MSHANWHTQTACPPASQLHNKPQWVFVSVGTKSVLTHLQALTLDREAFHALLGRLDSLRSMWRFEALQRVPLFAKLDHKTKAGVASALGQVNMPKGTAVVTQVGWWMDLRALRG